MRYLKMVFVVFSIILVSACGGLPEKTYYLAQREAAKSRPAYKQFQQLCSSPERSRINRTSSVEGYISMRTSGNDCDGGWDILVEHGYKYYECSTEKTLSHNLSIHGDIFRLEIGKDDNDKCISWDTIAEERSSHDEAREYKEKLHGKCFFLYKVSEPKSRYAKLFEFGKVDKFGKHILEFPNDSAQKNLISFNGVYVFNLKTKEILSIDRDYTYWPEGIDNKAVGKYTCDVDKNINELQVLIPES